MRFKKFAAIILMSTMIGTMSLSGCGGVNKDAVAITMTSDDKDAIEVTMGYANFAARIQQAGYDSVFASYYGDDYWTNDSYAKDGKNMQESIKDSVLESIETQYLLEKHMSDYGVEITEEDQAAIKKAAEQFMSDNSKAALKEVGATQEYVERYLYLQTVEKRMKAAISATADTNVSDEEAAQRTFSYMNRRAHPASVRRAPAPAAAATRARPGRPVLMFASWKFLRCIDLPKLVRYIVCAPPQAFAPPQAIEQECSAAILPETRHTDTARAKGGFFAETTSFFAPLCRHGGGRARAVRGRVGAGGVARAARPGRRHPDDDGGHARGGPRRGGHARRQGRARQGRGPAAR